MDDDLWSDEDRWPAGFGVGMTVMIVGWAAGLILYGIIGILQ